MSVTPVIEMDNGPEGSDEDGNSESDHVSFSTGSVTLLIQSVFAGIVLLVSVSQYHSKSPHAFDEQ